MIKVPLNNLFANFNAYYIELEDGQLWLVRERLVIPTHATDNFHTIKDNDELTTIAWKWYKNYVEDASKYWWIIADANPQIRNVVQLRNYVGQDILIPAFNRVQMLLQ